MKRGGGVLLFSLLAATTALIFAQENSAPAPGAEQLKALAARTAELGKLVSSLRRQGVADLWLCDVELYHRAVALAAQHQEITSTATLAWTQEALDRGLLRARLAATGELPWLQMAGHAIARGYRSRIDGSVQPYVVTFPANYGGAGKRWRLDVVLHGRDDALNEIKFLHQVARDRSAPKDQDYVRLDVFGRGNNAYRWAGETDVLEAIDAFVTAERQLGRDKLLDPARVVLRGFSMGGAGAWHLGLHLPDRWCLVGPGAGFTATHGYVKDLPTELPPWQEACLTIYDAIDYAENAFDVPVVGYCGAEDRLLEQMRNVESRLKSLAIPMTLLVAPELKHKSPPAEWQKKLEDTYEPLLAKGRPEYPLRVHFVTYTLRYARCDWVEILGLEQHYRRALVDAHKTEPGFNVQTSNVQCLHLTLPVGSPQSLVVNIDGQPVSCRPVISPAGTYNIYLNKQRKRWTAVLPQRLVTDQARRPRKAQGLQGPIDDAFTGSFLCVMGTEQPWHAAPQKLAVANLERFRTAWSKHWRGELPVKDDVDVSNDDLASRNLILFGDPASNSLIAQVLDGLPLRWTRETLTVAGKNYSSADHVPVLIYPSPLNAARYVVLNTGPTFPTTAYMGSNALLYPRLGDFAVLRVSGEVEMAGLFDEQWQVP